MARKSKTPPPPPTPKTPKPWDIPPMPQKGDDDAQTLYVAIGLALTNWNNLEQRLSNVFACLLTGEEPLPAERAYGAVVTFAGRMEMIKAAAEAFFFSYPVIEGEQLQSSLSELTKEALNFSARRNELAHGAVRKNHVFPAPSHFLGFLRETRSRADATRPAGFVLQPTDHTTKKTELEKGKTILTPVNYIPSYAYSSAEVLVFANHFERLTDRANRFPLVILGHRQRAQERAFPETSPSPSPEPKT
jgi:hypothetical protein